MIRITKFRLVSIIVLLTENAAFACDGYHPDNISNQSLIYKLIHGPVMLIATATYNLSPETLNFISDTSRILFCLLSVSTAFYVFYIFYKNNLVKRLCCILLIIYFIVLLSFIHVARGSYYCNGKPSATEVLSLLFTNS